MSSDGVLALLRLPLGSSLSLDGFPLVLKRDDFLGFTNVPGEGTFHLATVANPAADSSTSAGGIVCGVIMFPSSTNWQIVREYDQSTEEIGGGPLDPQTEQNLTSQMRSNQTRNQQQQILPYNKLLSTDQANKWTESTNHISLTLLRRRGLNHAMKVVPTSFSDDKGGNTTTQSSGDGHSASYPPIPCIGPSFSPRKNQHRGTKRYLANLSPSERTSLLLHENAPGFILATLVDSYYSNSWMEIIGDLQLSFTLFLRIHCFGSFEHWRDLVAMLSMVTDRSINSFPQLFRELFMVLGEQLKHIDATFFDEMEYSGENFLLPAIHRMCAHARNSLDENVRNEAEVLLSLISTNFGSEQINGIDAPENPVGHNEEDDDPVVVSYEEVEASLQRSAKVVPSTSTYPKEHRSKYPLLFASMLAHEDILMTCARALDEKVDVSVVREAAAYLEEVEAQRTADPFY